MRNALHWWLQRITGALLVVLLAAHFWVEHFITADLQRGNLTFDAIHARDSFANSVVFCGYGHRD